MNRYKTGYVTGLLYEGAAISALLLICRLVDTQFSFLKGNTGLVMLMFRLPDCLCLISKIFLLLLS